MEVVVLTLLGCGLLVMMVWCLLKWHEMRYLAPNLPPGIMGFWPLIGETSDFLKYGSRFMSMKKFRYGNLFKTHILGSPTVISMDRELNRYILLNERKGLVPGYPKAMVDVLGNLNIAAVHGPDHRRIRGSLLSLIKPSAIEGDRITKINDLMTSFMDDHLDGKTTIDLQEKTAEMAFCISFKQTMEKESMLFFKEDIETMVTATLSLPINFPGTNYYRGYQARKRVVNKLKQIINKRRARAYQEHDMLDQLLRNEDPKYQLSDDEIIDQIITILNSGYETVSKTTMMAIKYLHDCPKALNQLREEHLAIRARKKTGEPIHWNDYKSMTFTRAVILETSRLATVVNGVLRRTTEDLELNGYIIPKGWKIYVYTREINYDPLLYPEPLTFDPWRWLDKPLESHNYMFSFGGGSRKCPGKELGIVYVSTFLHYFALRYRWELVGGDEIVNFPRVQAPNGLYITLSKY